MKKTRLKAKTSTSATKRIYSTAGDGSARRDEDALEMALGDVLAGLGSMVVALSGGVDSSVVAAVATRRLADRALAVTGVSPSLAPTERAEIEAFCAAWCLNHRFIDTHEHEDPRYIANTTERCLFCKRDLFGRLRQIADARGFAAVVDGTNADDSLGHRPGRRAADEFAVVSPLLQLGATKDDVRRLARRLGLRNAERPASPCLSSRIAYGVAVTPERLARIAQGEATLRALGFEQVRVRLHDTIARVEVAKAQMAAAVERADAITAGLRALGFTYVTLDLAGLRSGSMLEVFEDRAAIR